MLVRFAVSYAQQVAPIIGTRIASGEGCRGRLMHEPQIAGMAAIAAAESSGRMLEQHDRRSRFAGSDRRREARISAAHNENVARFHHVRCKSGRSSRMSFMLSSARTLLMRLVVVVALSVGAIKSCALVTTSSRPMGFSAVPRTAST